ncbi:MAG: asparagine synthase (glutamine-hydrolyzing) [Deltaproteobacteria bacterium]|nr:asparagine synthase (glutamine-hydrolyzing) [Deltaproteobacteria bacterium]
MCGIAGIFAYSAAAPPVISEEVLRIRDAMIPRGPDGAGVWTAADGRLALAHRRLSIIDLSETGAQPMATADGSLRVVFNGEIYNYRELRRELAGQGHRFRSNSDTEVLLHLYRQHGPDLVDRLRGMYAFALWDEANRRCLLARDPFGIKPLYYADDGGTLRFASQVKALLAGGAVDTGAEPAGHVGFFLWGWVPEPYTLYRGVRALEPGAILMVEAGGQLKISRFCTIAEELRQAEAAGERLNCDHETMQARLRQAVTASVSRHLIADVPVGAFLSSGLDSSTLTALACQQGGRLNAITIGFQELKGGPGDETRLAGEVARRYGAEQQCHWITRQDFQRDLPRILQAMDQPSTDGVNTYFVAQAAAAAGLKAALSGLGGDELFGGYPSFREVPRLAGALAWTARFPGWGRAFRVMAAPVLKYLTSPKYAGLLEYGGTYPGAYLLRRGLFMPWELPEVLDPDLAREGWRQLQPLARLEETVQGFKGDHLRVSALEMSWYMRHQLLRDADWAGMAHSLEIRVPLVDLELLRQVAPLLVLKEPPTKIDLGLTPERPLPDEVLHRDKSGFYVPVPQWLAEAKDNHAPHLRRGLRGWAQLVYRHHTGAPCVS